MWPSDPEAQAYAVALLALVVTCAGLIRTVVAERRYWRRKLSRAGERHHDRVTGLRRDLDWALSQVEILDAQLRPAAPVAATLVDPVVQHWRTTPAWVATRSAEQTIVADVASGDPDATTRIHVTDDGRDMT